MTANTAYFGILLRKFLNWRGRKILEDSEPGPFGFIFEDGKGRPGDTLDQFGPAFDEKFGPDWRSSLEALNKALLMPPMWFRDP